MALPLKGRKSASSQPKSATRYDDNLFGADTVELVLALSEGPIQGLKDGASSFYVGDVPLLDKGTGTPNISNFELRMLKGTNPADSIRPNLGGFASSKNVGLPLRTENQSIVAQGDKTQIDYIDIRFVVNRLLVVSTTGGEFANGMTLKLEIKPRSSAVWQIPFDNQPAPPPDTSGASNYRPGTATAGSLVNAALHETYLAPDTDPPLQANEQGAMWFITTDAHWAPRIWDGAAWQVPNGLTNSIIDGFWVWSWVDHVGDPRRAWFSPAGAAPPAGSITSFDWLLTPESGEIVYSFNDTSWVGTQTFPDTPVAAPGNVVISGLTRSNYPKEYRIPVARINEPYDVRVTRLDPPSTKDNFKDVTFESIQEVVAQVYSFPDLALAWLTIRATDTFTSLPEFTGIYRGVIIPVPSNHVFNEDTQLSEFPGLWDGTFKMAYTNNPGWHAYNLIKNSRYGKNAYYPEVPDQWDYYEFGKHCSLHGFRFNEYISEARSLNELINYVVGIAGGRYVDRGDGYSTVIWDADDQQAVAIFAPENTIEGSFNYSFTDITERKNDFKVSFKNPQLEYREDRVRVWDQNAIDVQGRNPEEFVAVGCRDAAEAVKRGRLRLATSLTEKIIVNFKTNRLGRYLQPFQVILVADDQSTNVISGRVRNPDALPAGTTRLPLRDQIYLEAGVDYAAQFTLAADGGGLRVVTYQLTVAQPGLQSELVLAQPLADELPEYAVFSIGAPKAFRITSISQADEPDQLDITAIEVNRLKWAFVDGAVELRDLTGLQTGTPSNYVFPVTEARVTPDLAPDGTFSLNVTWEESDTKLIKGYRVRQSINGQPATVLAEPAEPSTRIVSPLAAVYSIAITAVSLDGRTESAPVTVQYTVADTTTVRSVVPPADLVLVDEAEAPLFRAVNPRFAWTPSTDPMLKDHLVEVLSPAGLLVHSEAVPGLPQFSYTLAQNLAENGAALRAFTVRVRARDTTGQLSEPVTVSVTHPAPARITPVIDTISETIFISYDAPAGDFAGVLIWMETGTGYDPLVVPPAYDGPNTSVALPAVPETTYFIRIAGYDAYGKTGLNIGPEIAAKATVTLFDGTPPPLPTKPVLTTDAEIAADGTLTAVLRATWSNTTGNFAGRYTVAVAQDGGSFLEFPYSVADGAQPAFELHGLRPAVALQVRVRAVAASGLGQSDWSSVATITTAASKAKPDNPTGVAAVGTYQGVTVSWTAPVAKDLAWIEVWSIDRVSAAQAPPSGAVMRKVGKGSTFVYDGTVPVGGTRTFWLRSVSTSGVMADGYTAPAGAVNAQIGGAQLADGAVTGVKIAEGTITGDRIQAGTIEGDRIKANSITTDQLAADAITADKITVGSAKLSSWVSGSDTTKIEGGKLSANSVTANSLKIGARGVQLVGVSFYAERGAAGALTNKFGWTAGQILVTADDGSPKAYDIPAGAAIIDAGYWYVWWSKAQTGKLQLAKDNWPAISNDAESILIATVSGVTGLSVLVGGTIIDGTRIQTGSIQAAQIAAGAIQAEKIAAGAITADKIGAGTITADFIFLGGNSFQLNAANQLIRVYGKTNGIEHVSIGQVGVFDGDDAYGITVRDGQGRNVLKVTDKEATIEGAFIRDATITNAKIGDLQVDTIKIAGKAVSQTVSATSDGPIAQLGIEARSETSAFQILAFRRGDGGRPHPALASNGELYVDFSDNGGQAWGNIAGIVNVFSYLYQPNVSGSSLFMMPTTLVFSWAPGVKKPFLLRVRDSNGENVGGVYLSVTELAK
ncbi:MULTISPECIES: phage tail protein [unclassified Methylobacterium]|uniref:TipJ family phage tail tip protein n=1 Tax=unclassified Methylobacterium TaxID=2615210 RepID=UPI0011C1DD11|nr:MULTISPECIES: phage tail protein [unclassified Methylobacterium]QEE37937.1 hypothetical protein FVA80_02130 [Methylobacterium sp. WL1]TXN59358.1 hypothetical protein FV241_02285 [Methylobacterium sp. WL2]